MIIKTLGYVIGGLGVVGVACWSVPQIKEAIPYMADLVKTLGGDNMLIIVSAILVLVGLFIAFKGGGSSSGSQPKEVPIFRGKHIVGYRRMN